MLVKLFARGLRPLSPSTEKPFVVRVAGAGSGRPMAEALLVRDGDPAPLGYRAYLSSGPFAGAERLTDAYILGPDHRYVAEGDVVRIDPVRRTLTALYRAGSAFNTFLVTERCDNLCVMCSQPPRESDDAALLADIETTVDLIAPCAGEIGISGGEPALLGARLVRLLELLRDKLPDKAVHVLSNGRRFSDPGFAAAVGGVRHPDLMIGVPLYSDLPEEHDFVVQARGAYDETVRGILNLKSAGVSIELRVVLHRQTYERLPELARFIARNLTFVDHVALMGLEHVGYAKANLDDLWVDPVDYQRELREAVITLERGGLLVSIYNHQLCIVDPSLHRIARKSISDWKNSYVELCHGCARKSDCGGFFETNLANRSRGITPYEELAR